MFLLAILNLCLFFGLEGSENNGVRELRGGLIKNRHFLLISRGLLHFHKLILMQKALVVA